MDQRHYESDLDQLRAGRKRLRLGIAVLLVIDALLTIRLVTLDTRVQTIVAPPEISKPFWIKGDQVSPSYLEQMARFFAALVLTYQPDSLNEQDSVFLRYVDPGAYGTLSEKLAAEALRVQHDRLSQTFFPSDVRVRPSALAVALGGDLISYVGDQLASRKHTIFVMRFVMRGGRPFVSSFMEAPDENHPFSSTDSAGTGPGRASSVGH
jgi:type IV conjugative transfer system protein TraE